MRPVHMTKEKTMKETLQYSGKRGIHPDHPYGAIEILFGMVGGLLAVVISFMFHHIG